MSSGLGKMVEYVNYIVSEVERCNKRPRREYQVWLFHTGWSDEPHIMKATVINEVAKKLRNKGLMVVRPEKMSWHSNGNILFITQKMNLRLLGELLWDVPQSEDRMWMKIPILSIMYFNFWFCFYNINFLIAEQIF